MNIPLTVQLACAAYAAGIRDYRGPSLPLQDNDPIVSALEVVADQDAAE